MRLTKLANTAIDLVAPRRDQVIAEIVNFAGTDLLCYRAEAPDALVERQAALWDPLIGWAAEQCVSFTVTSGFMHVPQPQGSLDAYGRTVAALDPFRIAGLHNAVTLTGSAILGLAVALGRLTPEEAFDIAHLDEHWQMEISGRDEEEEARLAARRAELLRNRPFHRSPRLNPVSGPFLPQRSREPRAGFRPAHRNGGQAIGKKEISVLFRSPRGDRESASGRSVSARIPAFRTRTLEAVSRQTGWGGSSG